MPELCLSNSAKKTEMRLLVVWTASVWRGGIKVFKEKKKLFIAGTYFDSLDSHRQVVLMCLTSGTVHECMLTGGGSGDTGGSQPCALSFTTRTPSKSCTVPMGISNSPSRSSAGLQ